MAKYSIKELERISGIKAHTLRIWEKRFDLLNPERTDTNIRYYSDEDLKKLLNVSLLCNSGEKISRVASLSDKEMAEAVQSLDSNGLMKEKRVDDFVKAMLDIDECAFIKTFDQCVEDMGYHDTIIKVIFPFLNKVGILWLSDEIQPIHEHFTTNLIRNKMIASIDALPTVENGKKGVLFLPDNEYHELGLIFFNFLLKQKGIKTYYLGQATPIAEVKALVETIKADFVLTYTMIKNKMEIQTYLEDMDSIPLKQKFFLEHKSQRIFKLNYPKGVSRLTEIDGLLSQV
ncbi:MAG: MerR family transcriptional regulator [Vicingaceae bacterium]